MRLVLAFILAPLTPAIVATIISKLTAPQIEESSIARILLVLALYSPQYAVPATLAFAIPLFLWFRRRGWLKLRHIIAGGTIVGVASAIAFAIYGLVTTPNYYHYSDGRLFVHWNTLNEGLMTSVVVFVPYAIVMAWIFWAVAFWKRKPNNTVERDGPKAARPSL
jgi:hypothetical protein